MNTTLGIGMEDDRQQDHVQMTIRLSSVMGAGPRGSIARACAWGQWLRHA